MRSFGAKRSGVNWLRRAKNAGLNEPVPEDTNVAVPRNRGFLRALAAVLAGAAASQFIDRPIPAHANYTPGTPSDTVDTNLAVQGNLVVNAPVGPTSQLAVGTPTLSGTLNVGGDVRVNGTAAIGTDLTVKQTYYAP